MLAQAEVIFVQHPGQIIPGQLTAKNKPKQHTKNSRQQIRARKISHCGERKTDFKGWVWRDGLCTAGHMVLDVHHLHLLYGRRNITGVHHMACYTRKTLAIKRSKLEDPILVKNGTSKFR